MDWSIDDISRLISEDLDDKDEFAEPDFWTRTFQSLLDEGGIEQLAYALRTSFPSDHVLDVGENYVIMSIAIGIVSRSAGHPSKDLRKVKIEFDPNQSIGNWLRTTFMRRLKEIENEEEPLRKDSHPLFFEGHEMGKPWGWQVSAAPVAPDKSSASGEGLDDEDEFLAGDENYSVTVGNKHYPGKEIAGVVGFNEHQHFPEILSVDRNDWNFPEEFAKKLLWTAWWASDEARHGEASFETQTVEPGEMFQIDHGGIELLKYHNDPEHYNKLDAQADLKPAGWSKVGTHTYREDLDDKDEFRPQYARPTSVVGHAYEEYPDASLIYDFDDGARLYYMSTRDITKFILREPDGTLHTTPTFRSSRDAPAWFDPYYQGMMVANVHEKDGKGMWARGPAVSGQVPIQPFTPQQRREWSQMTGSPVMKENLDDKDEFGSPYKISVVCGWCKKPMGLKSTDDPKMHGQISHGMCQECEAKWLVKEDLDDKDEFGPDCGFCTRYGGLNDGFHNAHTIAGREAYKLSGRAPQEPEWWDAYHEIFNAKMQELGFVREGWRQGLSSGFSGGPWIDKPVTEDLDDKDEFTPATVHDICIRCDAVVGAENLVPASSDPIYGNLAGSVCKACKEILDQGPQDDMWLREDIDDKDEFISEKNYIHAWVKWPEGQFAGPDEAVAAAVDVMLENGYQITVEDLQTFKPMNRELYKHWRHEKVGVYCYVTEDLIEVLKSDGDLTFGSTQHAPWVAFCIDVGDNEKYFPAPDPDEDYRDSFRESIDNIARTINEETITDIAKFLNSRKVIPWTYAPGAGDSPRFSIRPGHEGECVDEESGLMDSSGNNLTREYEEQYGIYTHIDTWTPPSEPKITSDDPTLIDDTDEFYTQGSECRVFTSMGKYGPDLEQAVFYNGRWQTVEW